jgi:hypothetical protein
MLRPFGYTRQRGWGFELVPKIKLTEPFEPLINIASAAQSVSCAELLIAPMVVFTEVNAGGQLGALTHADPDNSREAKSSIQRA